MNEDNILKFVSVGQALIRHDLRQYNHKDFIDIIKIIKESDVAFTNLETSIISEIGGWPTKTTYYAGSEPYVLDVLKWMGFNLLSLANNHSFDCGPFGARAGSIVVIVELYKYIKGKK